jgi:hypothetical protein
MCVPRRARSTRLRRPLEDNRYGTRHNTRAELRASATGLERKGAVGYVPIPYVCDAEPGVVATNDLASPFPTPSFDSGSIR